ncbi:protein kinase [Streptomyces sp. C184]|uniref:protein kinase domain-containing protein n=1 Tax=Streptomyces sp. C184 TaxID=3237121 RepID=UPI0034C6C7C7
MSEPELPPTTAVELSAADLDQLGAQPSRRSDPAVIGPYRVLARLGGGGMGRLYLARHEDVGAGRTYRADDLVAVKVIRSEYAEDPRFRRRFEREIEAVRRVHGKYTAGLLGSGTDAEDRLWMATSYVPGVGLDDAVRRYGPLPAPVVWRLAGEAGQALASIAAAGMVHRDVKPSNVLLGADGARVIDFGVAHTVDSSALTLTGQQVGTPSFMSPEQADGKKVGIASDVFSLGSVLALAATGRAPFGEGSTGEIIHRVIFAEPEAEVLDRVAENDPALAELIGRCLAKTTADRPTPREVAEAARKQSRARKWPAPLAELIESRAGWSGRAVVVPVTDQLTVLRRRAPRPTLEEPPTRPRRRLLAGAVALLAVASAAVAAVLWPGGSPQAREAASAPNRPHASATAAPSRAGTTGRPSAAPTTRAPGSGGRGDAGERGGGGERGGNGQAPAPPADTGQRPPAPVVTVTAKPHPGPTRTRTSTTRTCNAYSGTALTVYGNSGPRVVEVQCLLRSHGYSLGSHGIDGRFGKDTRSSVEDFQRAHHLRVDGEVGAHTWAALRT